MFTKKTKKAGKKGGKPFGGKGAAPFGKKASSKAPARPMPMMEDDTALDARIGQTFRGGNPGGGKALPSRPPWA